MSTCPRCKLPKFDWRNPNASPSPTCDSDEGIFDRQQAACRDREIALLKSKLSTAEAKLEEAERENRAWRALVHWTHRGIDRGLDAYDDDVLIVASDKVVFIGKTALECVESIPAAKERLESLSKESG